MLRKHFLCAILTLSARRKDSKGWQTSKKLKPNYKTNEDYNLHLHGG